MSLRGNFPPSLVANVSLMRKAQETCSLTLFFLVKVNVYCNNAFMYVIAMNKIIV